MGLIEGACPAALAAGYDDVGTDPQGMDHMEGPVDWSALIPDAMWSEVLGYLGVHGLGRAGCACRRLRDACDDESLWASLWEGPLPGGFQLAEKAAHAALWLLAKGDVDQTRLAVNDSAGGAATRDGRIMHDNRRARLPQTGTVISRAAGAGAGAANTPNGAIHRVGATWGGGGLGGGAAGFPVHVSCMAISGRVIATAAGGEISVWDLEDAAPRAKFNVTGHGSVTCLLLRLGTLLAGDNTGYLRSFDISIAGGRPLHEIRTHADRVSAIDAFADLNSTHKPRRSGVAVVEGKGPRLQVFPEVEGYTPGMAAGYPPAGADGGSGGSRRLSRTGLDGVRADSGAQELSYASAGEGAAAALPRATTPGYAAPSSGGRSRRWDQGHGWGEGWVVGGENTTSVAPRVDAGRLSPTVPDVVSSAVVGPAAGAAAAVFGDSGSVGARSATSTSEKPEQALFRRKGRATSFQRAAALGMTGNGGHAGDHGGGKFAGRCGVGRNRRAVSSFSGYCLGHQSEERTDEDIEDRRGAYRTMTSRDNGFRSDDNVPVTAGGGRGGRGGGRGWGRGRGTGQPHEMGSLFAFAHDEPARLGKRQGYAGRGQGEFPRDVDEPRDENNLMYGWSMGNNEDGLDDGGDKDRGRGLGRDSGGGVGTRRDGHGEGQQQQVVLFTGSDDGTAKAWDAETGRLVRIYAGHSRGVTCLQATSTESYGPVLVTGGGDSVVIIWELATGQCLEKLETGVGLMGVPDGHGPRVGCLQAYGNSIVVGEDRHISIWSFTKGQRPKLLRRNFCEHQRPIRRLDVVGPWIVTCSGDYVIRLWDSRSGLCVREMGTKSGAAITSFRLSGLCLLTTSLFDPSILMTRFMPPISSEQSSRLL